MNILDYIPYGRQNAVTREKLCGVTGYSDRVVRQSIERLRHEGNIILNDQSGRGYYRSKDVDEIEKQYRQNQHRALSILHYQKPLRSILKQAGRI